MHLVIIGNGITSITCARHIRKKNDMKITVISGETEYFFSRTALMYVYMGHMKFENIIPYEDWFWGKNKIDLVHNYVTSIDTGSKTIYLDNNNSIIYDKLIIATGSQTNKFGWRGQDLPGVQGLYSKQDLDLLEVNTKNINHAVIVGGGLIGIELAEMLHSRNIQVTFLVRENFYWDNVLPQEESILVSKHILEHGFELKFNTRLKEILPGENGRVHAVITDRGEKIPCQFAGLTPGVHPNIGLVKNSKINTNRGILVNEFLETNIPDVYSAGDCAEIIYPDRERHVIEQLWYTGRMQGEVLAQNILDNKIKYDRGVWFNSAKFLDIEYQTYGFVSNTPLEGEESFYWEHKNGKKCLRIVYDADNRLVKGFNVFGIRLRHKVCEKWILQKKTVDYVMENLREANFDPEFNKRHEDEIVAKYNQENPGENITLNKKSKFLKIFS